MKRVILLVIDSLGVGYAPDADIFGDVGANTLAGIAPYLDSPVLARLGLYELCDSLKGKSSVKAKYARLQEKSIAKDTTTGHFEMTGIITRKKMPTYLNGFPKEIVEALTAAFGVGILGNCTASGTEIIKRLGDEHIMTRKPIVYTSADSVLQIACHDKAYSLEELYELCRKARAIMTGENEVGRVIARPFTTIDGEFVRTKDRKDFGITPPDDNLLERIVAKGLSSAAVGKIMDIFSGKGITKPYSAHGNEECFSATVQAMSEIKDGLIFVNLVDTDMLYGHRNDAMGYAECVNRIDRFLLEDLLPYMKDEDLLIITADHGCDPTYLASTDHTREYVPYLEYMLGYNTGIDLGTILGFDYIAKRISEYLEL